MIDVEIRVVVEYLLATMDSVLCYLFSICAIYLFKLVPFHTIKLHLSSVYKSLCVNQLAPALSANAEISNFDFNFQRNHVLLINYYLKTRLRHYVRLHRQFKNMMDWLSG